MPLQQETCAEVGTILDCWMPMVYMCKIVFLVACSILQRFARIDSCSYIHTQSISVQNMTCAVCLQDGATYACECTLFHPDCFAHVLMREGTHECRICHSKYDRELLATASEIAFQKTVDVFGTTSGTTRVRQLELASALAEVSQITRARSLFTDLIGTESDPKWIHSVAKIELARLEKDCGDARKGRDLLEELLPILLREKERWGFFERIECYTCLGACYVALGNFENAETFLFMAIENHLANEHANPRNVVKCMQEIAKFYDARADLPLAHETRRVALNILRSEETDMGRVALAQLELAKSEVVLGEKSAAAAHYRAAIRILRKRRSKVCLGALPAARRELAALVKPKRRLRGKTVPEDC